MACAHLPASSPRWSCIPIFQFGSDEQKKFWLPRLATAEAVGCFGLTEPDFGSNPGGMLTRARRERGGYVLNGTKRWITNGSISDLAVVWAKLEEDGTDVIRGLPGREGTHGLHPPRHSGQVQLPGLGHLRVDF